jgi:hypothetical protein
MANETTELGVYILGAMALAILVAAGIALGSPLAVIAAVASAGLSYLAQLLSAIATMDPASDRVASVGAALLYLSLMTWLAGLISLVVVSL